MTSSVRCAATSAMRRALQEGHTPRPLQEKARSRSCPQSVQRSRANPCGLTPARRSGGSPAGSAKPTRGPGCRSGDNRESRVPPRWGPPIPWSRLPAPRRGRSPGDAGPPGRAVFRRGGGDDRQRRQGGTSAPGSSPTIDARQEMGCGRPSPKPRGIRGPGHGWISQALPSPQVGPKQKSGREGSIRRRKRAGALGSRSTRLRGTKGFLHAPPVAPDAGPGARERCARSEEDRLHHPIRAAGSSVTPDRRRNPSVRHPRCESIDRAPGNSECFNAERGVE